MITVAVCDDSISMVKSLKANIEEYAEGRKEEIRVFTFHSGIELLENYKGKYDILFLDIKMLGMDGVKVAETIRKMDKKVIIIFLTSLLQHALDGYRVNAANYIIKPIGKKKLQVELDRWINELTQKEEPFITFHNDSGNYKLLLKSISYIETYNRNLLIHTDKGNYICYWKLKDMESKLKVFGFSRNHSSYLVNLFYVDSIQKMDIRLCNGEIIPISKTKKKDFMEDLAKFWGGGIYMKSKMFFQIFDICITCFELGGYYYLIKTEKRKKDIKRTLLFFALLLAVIVIMSAIEMSLFPKYSIVIALMTIGGSVVFDCSIFKNFLYSIVCIFSIQCSESLATQVWQMVNSPKMLRYYPDMDINMISMIIASNGIYFLLMAIFQKIMQRNVDSKTKFNEIVPIVVSGLPFIVVLECLSVNLPYYLSETKMMIFSLGSSVLILLVFIFEMIFTQYYNRIRKKALLEEHTINELQLKYEYYKNKKENEELIKEIYHDLKNYFLIYKDDLISEELRKKLSAYENYYMTGNELLDVIISDKLRKAASNNIQVECKIDFKDGQFIEALDISTIFGNLLDNAIEACVKMPESERLIWINVGRKRQFILVQVKNTAIYDCQKDIGKMTDKPNRYLHGYGIANIKKAVRKYDGECRVAFNNGIFEVTIVIPILIGGEL